MDKLQVSEALKRRKSTRAFLDKDVEAEKIQRILQLASHAPSGTNTQPWQVAVVRGKTKNSLQEKLEAEFRAGHRGSMDYRYYPEAWVEPYRSRRKACGLQLYQAMKISRDDKQRQRDQWAANYRAFGAPVVLFFFLDSGMQAGSFLDYGMFLQSVMLAAVEEGLATCPQAALAQYPGIVKRELGYPPQSQLLCGMALGYEDSTAPINNYRTTREAVENFTRLFE